MKGAGGYLLWGAYHILALGDIVHADWYLNGGSGWVQFVPMTLSIDSWMSDVAFYLSTLPFLHFFISLAHSLQTCFLFWLASLINLSPFFLPLTPDLVHFPWQTLFLVHATSVLILLCLINICSKRKGKILLRLLWSSLFSCTGGGLVWRTSDISPPPPRN